VARIDEVRERISLASKLLMGFFATIVVTVGGLVGMFVSGGNRQVLWAGVATVIVLFGVCLALLFKTRQLTGQLGEL